MHRQEKQHVHEKEMQQQKLQEEKNQRQDVNVVHLQEKLREEEQQEKLLAEEQQEDDADLFLFFFNLHLIRTVNLCLIQKILVSFLGLIWIRKGEAGNHHRQGFEIAS